MNSANAFRSGTGAPPCPEAPAGILKILIESGSFQFYENQQKTHFDIWQKAKQGENGVFNGV
jgi:hypothetical protein